MIKQFQSYIPERTQMNLLMKAIGLTKIPLLFATSPKITKINSTSCHVQMPFRKIVKNHLGSVYFGALAIGADTCVGFLTQHKIMKSSDKISLIFKDFKADFLMRAEGPVIFVCEEGEKIDAMILKTKTNKERVSEPIKAFAKVNDQIVAEFTLTLSLKLKS